MKGLCIPFSYECIACFEFVDDGQQNFGAMVTLNKDPIALKLDDDDDDDDSNV